MSIPSSAACTPHGRADRATREFALRTGLACPPGCGACCVSPNVETSVAECTSLATALVDAGRAEEVLARIAERDNVGDRACVLYEPSGTAPGSGRCTAYEHRPLVCRLFGFAARRDRLGARELVACAVMRDAIPAVVASAERAVREGAPAPVFADHVLAATAGTEGTGARPRPINAALRMALERACLERRLSDDGRDEAAREPTPTVATPT